MKIRTCSRSVPKKIFLIPKGNFVEVSSNISQYLLAMAKLHSTAVTCARGFPYEIDVPIPALTPLSQSGKGIHTRGGILGTIESYRRATLPAAVGHATSGALQESSRTNDYVQRCRLSRGGCRRHRTLDLIEPPYIAAAPPTTAAPWASP